jgi:hypothetical protein
MLEFGVMLDHKTQHLNIYLAIFLLEKIFFFWGVGRGSTGV